MMKSINMTDEAIKEYMRDKGIVFEAKQLFDIPEPVAVPGASPDPEAAPSRERKGEGEANAKIGTGNESTTREDQLVKKAFDIEPSDQWRHY